MFNIDNTSGIKLERKVNKQNFRRPAYSYTSICPDEEYRIIKKNKKLSSTDDNK